MSQSKQYVRRDENGVYRVGATRVMLDSVVASFEQGHSAETIRQQYPSLALEEAYGAITYYLAHADEVKEYLGRQGALWEEWRSKSAERGSPVAERLRALRGADVPEDS
ncbi:MAG: DUF433 domain-containing protein [Planctomycetota bacterium]|nr:DUF433 domain-containing protein [Planctomycetota bacterium]